MPQITTKILIDERTKPGGQVTLLTYTRESGFSQVDVPIPEGVSDLNAYLSGVMQIVNILSAPNQPIRWEQELRHIMQEAHHQ